MALADATSDLFKLPAAKRLELMEAIWDSLEAEAESMPLADWQRDELDRRLDALNSGASVGAPWDEVCARIRRKP